MSETWTSDDLTVITVNYQTPDLLQQAVRSFRRWYPKQELLIVDNGSKDDSAGTIEGLVAEFSGCTNLLMLDQNIFHGPAMHRAMENIHSTYVFFLDSDTEVFAGGFLQVMENELESDQRTYAIGRINHVNKRGFPAHDGIPIVLSPYMMLRRKMYFSLPPFEHHGMPTLKNFTAAHQQGLPVKNFPIDQYIHHRGRGTASRFGYGLGIKGKMDYVLNKLGL